jgi:hypothetical protein
MQKRRHRLAWHAVSLDKAVVQVQVHWHACVYVLLRAFHIVCACVSHSVRLCVDVTYSGAQDRVPHAYVCMCRHAYV